MELRTIHTRSIKIKRDCEHILMVCDAYNKIPIKRRTPKVVEDFLKAALSSIRRTVERGILPKATETENDIIETYTKLNSLKNEGKKDRRTDKGNAK